MNYYIKIAQSNQEKYPEIVRSLPKKTESLEVNIAYVSKDNLIPMANNHYKLNGSEKIIYDEEGYISAAADQGFQIIIITRHFLTGEKMCSSESKIVDASPIRFNSFLENEPQSFQMLVYVNNKTESLDYKMLKGYFENNDNGVIEEAINTGSDYILSITSYAFIIDVDCDSRNCVIINDSNGTSSDNNMQINTIAITNVANGYYDFDFNEMSYNISENLIRNMNFYKL